MCTHQYPVTNIYTRKQLYVKCGKCPACLQEKAAHRVTRIKNASTADTEKIMVSLTYKRGTSPYIDRNEAYLFSKGKIIYLNVYRDCSCRRVRIGSGYDTRFKFTYERKILDTIRYAGRCTFTNCKDMKHEHNKISVNYYPDYQRFMARLRLNLKRDFDYDKPFKTYACSEYGTISHRSHFHILMDIPKGDYETFRSAIIKSWPFSDLSRFPRAIEKAFRGSSYVASYVNSGTNFPTFLERYFKPKHSYSKDYGFGNSVFRVDSLLSYFNRGTMSYRVLRDKQGIPTISDVPFPAYVIHRYFPKFKGYSRISPVALESVIQRIYYDDYPTCKRVLDMHALYLSDEEFHKVKVRLQNAFIRFNSECCAAHLSPVSFQQWSRMHNKIWRLHASTVLRLHMENGDIPLNEKYDNLDYVSYSYYNLGCPLPSGFSESDLEVTDPNKFKSVIVHTIKFENDFYQNIKHRSVSNSVMSIDSDEW